MAAEAMAATSTFIVMVSLSGEVLAALLFAVRQPPAPVLRHGPVELARIDPDHFEPVALVTQINPSVGEPTTLTEWPGNRIRASRVPSSLRGQRNSWSSSRSL